MKYPIQLSLSVAVTAALAAQSGAQTCTATIAQTEGPYYRTPNPETQDMRRGTDGPLFTFRGRVVDTACAPIPWTWVALWHADPAGAYDNVAPYDVYRATYFTDGNGEFVFRTIKPGLYPGRTRHMHVKVDAANTGLLTTQMYWPGEPQNASDGIYSPALQMTLGTGSDGVQEGFFQFVLQVTGGCTGATITSSPASLAVQPGETATFTAGAAGSAPRTFRWYRNGVELQNGGRIAGATTGTLVISAVTAADAGSYQCASLNSCGSQTSASATLTVGTTCPGDADRNGRIDGADIGLTLASWGPCAGCPADSDGNGAVDGLDLANLLSGWGPCS